MDDTKTQLDDQNTTPQTGDVVGDQTVDETPTQPAAKEQPVEEAVEAPKEEEKLEAPEKPEELEAPKEEKIETKEEEGQPPAPEQVKVEPTATTSPSDEYADAGKWYIVHTYSGHENKVAKSLHQRIESMGFEKRIFEVIVPTRNTVRVSQGKKESVKEKIFPGYVLVRMILDDESWLLVRTTQGVTAFIGVGNKPTPISDKEVDAIQKFMNTEEPLYKTAFSQGEAVKIVDGPFTDFLGTVDTIDEAKGKVKVLVSIFGRETPVELDFLQVSKL